MSFNLALNKEFLNELFPFYIMVDDQLVIKHAGDSFLKLSPKILNTHFTDNLTLRRPSHVEYTFDSFLDFQGQIFIIKIKDSDQDIMLRYELKYIAKLNCFLLLGSPWIYQTDDLKKLGLQLKDFALHDSMTDLLQVLTIKDINNKEVRQLNKKLEKSEQRYRQIVESAHDMIYYTDAAGNLTYVNPVILEKFNVKEKEILGLNFLDFIPPSNKKEVFDFYVQMKDEKTRKTYLEFPIHLEGGKIMWIGQNVAANKDANSEIISFTSVARDITERMRIEENLKSTELRLRNLITNLQAGILVEDENRKIVLTNQFFCELFKIPAPPETLTGMDCSGSAEQSKSLFKDPEKFVKEIDETLKQRETIVALELKMADGRILERDYIPIILNGKYLGHLWQYRDVTEKKQAEDKLIAARKEAEQAQKAEEYFLARMSHEIRTPLNAVVGMTHLLKETDTSHEQNEYIEILEASAEILQNLISDILDLSKIASGQLKVRHSIFDLTKNLQSVTNSFKHRLLEKSVRLIFKMDDQINPRVKTDKLLLNQIIINLLSNASKFTEAGTITLETQLLEKKANKQLIRISVADTGIGVSEGNKTKIFEQFKQADRTINQKYGGTGLGLYIVKQLVELMGGTLHLESKLDEGSRFSLDLTVNIAAQLQQKTAGGLDSLQSLKDLSVLVAEDNIMNQKLISRLLEKWSIKFDLVQNGKEVLQILDEKAFDLILMDIQMPIMNGMEATRAIRNSGNSKFENIPIIALTASALTDHKMEAEKVGFSDFISKPFRPEILKEKLRTHASHKEPVNEPNRSINAELDEDYLSEFYGGDVEHAAEMFQLFLDHEYPEFLALKEVLILDEREKARKLIHKISPSFTMVGLSKVTQDLNDLKSLIKANEEKPALIERLNSIEGIISDHLPGVQSELEKLEQLINTEK